MKKINSIISMLLSIILVTSVISTPISADALTINVEKYVNTDNISMEEYHKTDEARKIYNSLSKDARDIFDRDLQGIFYREKYGIKLKSISASLSALNLPTPVLYSLQSLMAGFVAAAADGPLPFGDAILVASSIAVATTIAIYWYDVAPKWDQIVNIFKQEISGTSDTIGRIFAKIKGEANSKKPTGRKVKDVKNRLKKEGFKKIDQNGSHEKWKKGDKTVTVPNHGDNRDIDVGTLRNIWRQAGWIR